MTPFITNVCHHSSQSGLKPVSPSNAKATVIVRVHVRPKYTDTTIFENHLNTVRLVFIG